MSCVILNIDLMGMVYSLDKEDASHNQDSADDTPFQPNFLRNQTQGLIKQPCIVDP